MVNAWSLAASVLDGTLDEDYPIMKKDDFKVEDYDDGSPYTQTYLADNDDQASHHFTDSFDYLMSQTLNSEGQKSESMAHYYKYHEEEILKDIETYV